MEKKYYAHSLPGRPPEEWQPLEEHLKNVAELARDFAEPFGAGDLAFLAGLWHDLGKYQNAYQNRLRGKAINVEHSGAGAAHAFRKNKEWGLLLAFAIAGHHSGLGNLMNSSSGDPTAILDRVRSNQGILEKVLPLVPESLASASPSCLPPFLTVTPEMRENEKKANLRRCELWTRVLFSTLIDADRLDAEKFVNNQRIRFRGGYESIEILKRNLTKFLKNKISDLAPEMRNTAVNKVRAQVLASCRRAAKEKQGVFTLTVPTGGGKTLSAMAFALGHAVRHGLRRVIVVIPYTSIIEQNASEYRLALGINNLIEHHANLDFEEYRRQHGEEETLRMELASENWDAPVIITTTVQFFESLFSNRPSQCRKIHNIAKSVIILDEVQTLPPEYLMCITDVLKELTTNYGCSVVLSTATPPALAARERFEWGLRDVREIISNPETLAIELNRVEYSWPDLNSPAVSWVDLSEETSQYHQVLIIVHRRDDAHELAVKLRFLLGDDSVFHLSALMCPAHRTEVLVQVKGRLRAGKACRLVSTQLIEAGVDVDFPVVYRALGGLDSVVQAAGRCNREGLLKLGKVIIFRAPSKPPSGTPSKAKEIAEGLLRQSGGQIDVSRPDIFSTYFRGLYFGSDLDAKRVQTLRQELKFAEIDREFRLIEDGFTHSVVVPYGQASERLKDLQRNGPSRSILRSLQPFIVSIYPKAFYGLSSNGVLEEVAEGLFAVNPIFEHLYTSHYGLTVGEEILLDPGGLIV